MPFIERLDKPWLSVCDGSCAVLDDSWEARDARHEHPGYVYFIGPPGLTGQVKIGWARSPVSRLSVLQVGSRERLVLYASFKGSREDEAQMHNAFSYLRTKGEWFEYDHDLMLLIIGLGADYNVTHNDGTECGQECNRRIIGRFRSQLERRYDATATNRRLMRLL